MPGLYTKLRIIYIWSISRIHYHWSSCSSSCCWGDAVQKSLL